jgi:hypothetical protein
VDETTAPETPETPKPKAGFAVFFDDDGNVYIERSPEALKVEVTRPATLLEVRRAVSEILYDLQAQAAAEYARIALTPLPHEHEE